MAQKWEEPKLKGKNNIKETLRTTEYCISTHDWVRSGLKGGLGGLPSCQRQGVVGFHVFMMSLHIGVMVFFFFFASFLFVINATKVKPFGRDLRVCWRLLCLLVCVALNLCACVCVCGCGRRYDGSNFLLF